jgi:integrase/recombinase XerD
VVYLKQFTFISKRKVADKFDLNEQINRFLHVKKVEKRSNKTIAAYAQTLNQFRKWFESNGDSAITNDIIRSYIHYLTYDKAKWDDHPTSPTGEIGLSATAINNFIRISKVFFNYLIKEQVISQSPLEGVKYQSQDNNTFEVFTDEDVLKLLASPNKRTYTGYRDYVFMLVLTDTGCRIGELTEAKVSDVDFKRRYINLRAETTKTNQARIVPISVKTVKEIENLISFINIESDDYLWLTQFGERYYSDTFGKMLKKYGKKAGITGVRISPHTFRHYFAVKFLRSGGDPFALMRILGHASFDMTKRYVRYTEIDLSEQHAEASPVTNLIDVGNTKKRGKILFR